MKINFQKKILGYFRSATIKKKLMLSFFVLIFIPLTALTAITYINVSKGYEKQIKFSANQSFDQAYKFLSYKINSLVASSDIVYFNTDVQTVLTKGRGAYENDIVQQNIDMNKLDSFLYSFRNTEDVFRVCIYVPGWLTYADQDINFSNIDKFKKTADYKKLMTSQDKVIWMAPDKIKDETNMSESVTVLSLLRKIRSREKIGDIIGIVKVSIREENIKDIITKANITKTGAVYIQNSEGSIICSSNPDISNNFVIKDKINQALSRKNLSWDKITVGTDNYTVNAKDLLNTDWTLVTAIPYSEMLSESIRIRNLLIVLTLVIGLISYIVAYLISKSTTDRIVMLKNKMERVQEGDLEVSIASASQDEIGILINSFNYMVKRISILAEEQYKTGKDIKNAELKALQAQINPHFLYNTLDLINWKAIDNNVPEIAEISRSLAKFYKLSLSRGKDIITIQDEINHAKTYVEIQNLRFSNCITFEVDVEEELYGYYILKLILQPIVENSILHGILENRDRRMGTISLTGRLENETVLLTVEDDGAGMTKERAEEILTVKGTSENHGYGVRNINNRIKLCYGQQYGLIYHSAPGKGTLVEIRIPKMKTDELPSV
jgi:two-component system sensor histidine kinase YesM